MFSKLIGNPVAKSILDAMVTKRSFPHAFLFYGPAGVGKKQFALTLAKGILGHAHAKKIDLGAHPDVRLFLPEGKTGMHVLASIHQLQQQMALAPFEASSRVFIIEDAERMLPTSSNALLKTLEEPQADNYLILLTHSLQEVIGTVHSRCRKIPFFSVANKEISSFLQASHGKTEGDSKKLSYLARGSIGQALSLAKGGVNGWQAILTQILSTPPFSPLTHGGLLSELEHHLMECEEDSVRFYAQMETVFEEVYYWYRDLHLLSAGASVELLFHFDAQPLLQALRKQPLPALDMVRTYLEEAHLALSRSMKIKYILEYLFGSILLHCEE